MDEFLIKDFMLEEKEIVEGASYTNNNSEIIFGHKHIHCLKDIP